MGRAKIIVKTEDYDKFDIPPRAKKELIRKKLNGKINTAKPKYSKHDFVLHDGYDFLENLHFVRHYICRKHKIRLEMLELLLYFYPKQCFTTRDFKEYPRMFNMRKAHYLVEGGFFSIVTKGSSSGTGIAIYTLSRYSANIVRDMYKHLSGEKKIPESYNNNPFLKATTSAIDKKRFEVIKKLNNLPVSESKGKLFR